MRPRTGCARLASLFLATGIFSFAASAAFGMATEEVGNDPLPEANYSQWQGTNIMPVINHTSRVYHTWVNGNEHFYYEGDAAALSDFLAKYAFVWVSPKEIVILPGPGGTSTFGGNPVRYDWRLHLLTGLAAAHFDARPGSEIELGERNPTLTIFVGSGNFQLKDVKVPAGITLVGPDQLRERYLAALKSDDADLCKQAARALAGLDPSNAENIPVFLKMLAEGGDGAYAAADGLQKMGASAKTAVPAMREMLSGSDELVKTRILDAIDAIEAAPDTTEKDAARRSILAEIKAIIAVTNQRRAVEREREAAEE